jgi:peptide-methionine (R)-S-oxide reductase
MKGKSDWNTLTEEEQRVIIHKGTEYPFTGQYDKFFEKGSMFANNVNLLYTPQTRNLIQGVVGQHLIKKFLVP